MGRLSGPTYSKGAQLPRVLFPNGLPHRFQSVTGTLSWLLAVLLSGLVRAALTVLSPGVVAVVGMVYVLQQTRQNKAGSSLRSSATAPRKASWDQGTHPDRRKRSLLVLPGRSTQTHTKHTYVCILMYTFV
jgi:hypothetical protein